MIVTGWPFSANRAASVSRGHCAPTCGTIVGQSATVPSDFQRPPALRFPLARAQLRFVKPCGLYVVHLGAGSLCFLLHDVRDRCSAQDFPQCGDRGLPHLRRLGPA